jgi:hypothetical protein
VQDADEAVADGAERLVVGVSVGAAGVVVGAGAGAGRQGGEGLQVQGVASRLLVATRARTTRRVPERW